MRSAYGYRTGSLESHKEFCKKHPDVKLSYDEYKNIIYSFNYMFVEHILETGEKVKLPAGLGDFSINKRKRKKTINVNGVEMINLPIDWKKTKEKGKRIYNFNFHTEGYNFKWNWFKRSARFKHSDLFYFKPSRITSRLLGHYLKVDEKYQHTYATWIM
jgi:nucleoid DNA-binding protein